MNRKYFEVWGDSLALLQIMRIVIIVLAFAVIGLILLLRIEMNKLPIQVRVHDNGRPEIVTDWNSVNTISVPEIHNFVQTFMKFYTAYNFYTWDENFRNAFDMMTLKFQPTAQQYLVSNQVDVDINKYQYKTKVYLSDPYKEIVDSKDCIKVKVNGCRTFESYINPDFKKEVIFDAEFVLRKVPRGIKDQNKKDSGEVSPWGVLVDYYNETVYKQ